MAVTAMRRSGLGQAAIDAYVASLSNQGPADGSPDNTATTTIRNSGTAAGVEAAAGTGEVVVTGVRPADRWLSAFKMAAEKQNEYQAASPPGSCQHMEALSTLLPADATLEAMGRRINEFNDTLIGLLVHTTGVPSVVFAPKFDTKAIDDHEGRDKFMVLRSSGAATLPELINGDLSVKQSRIPSADTLLQRQSAEEFVGTGKPRTGDDSTFHPICPIPACILEVLAGRDDLDSAGDMAMAVAAEIKRKDNEESGRIADTDGEDTPADTYHARHLGYILRWLWMTSRKAAEAGEKLWLRSDNHPRGIAHAEDTSAKWLPAETAPASQPAAPPPAGQGSSATPGSDTIQERTERLMHFAAGQPMPPLPPPPGPHHGFNSGHGTAFPPVTPQMPSEQQFQRQEWYPQAPPPQQRQHHAQDPGGYFGASPATMLRTVIQSTIEGLSSRAAGVGKNLFGQDDTKSTKAWKKWTPDAKKAIIRASVPYPQGSRDANGDDISGLIRSEPTPNMQAIIDCHTWTQARDLLVQHALRYSNHPLELGESTYHSIQMGHFLPDFDGPGGFFTALRSATPRPRRRRSIPNNPRRSRTGVRPRSFGEAHQEAVTTGMDGS